MKRQYFISKERKRKYKKIENRKKKQINVQQQISLQKGTAELRSGMLGTRLHLLLMKFDFTKQILSKCFCI